MPAIWPAAQQIQSLGADVPLPDQVLVVADAGADQATRDVVVSALRDGGATNVGPAPLIVRVGALSGPSIRASGVALPSNVPAEGYFTHVGSGQVVLGGVDLAGSYHAAQTLWQLMQSRAIPAVRITDWPTMRVRGTVQGAYGSPWTYAEELDHLDFAARVKFNHYIHAPKEDPYYRDNWQGLYPAGRIGVRSFSLPLDDIDYNRWNCSGDQTRYGSPNSRNAARAQVDLLNRLQREFLPTLASAGPLQTVPTEYWDTDDSPYKSTIRASLDSRVIMMWTGVGVTPTSIEIFEARNAETVWGRKPLVWDNYPVNDYPQSAGRLLLAPYAERKAGINAHLTGITANPMNQAAASKVVLFGLADFCWNEHGYDPDRNYRQVAAYLAAAGAGDGEQTGRVPRRLGERRQARGDRRALAGRHRVVE